LWEEVLLSTFAVMLLTESSLAAVQERQRAQLPATSTRAIGGGRSRFEVGGLRSDVLAFLILILQYSHRAKAASDACVDTPPLLHICINLQSHFSMLRNSLYHVCA
jgi:hypothetical protein